MNKTKMQLIKALVLLVLIVVNMIGLEAGLFGKSYKEGDCIEKEFDSDECTQCCGKYKLEVWNKGKFEDVCSCDNRPRMVGKCLDNSMSCQGCCRKIELDGSLKSGTCICYSDLETL